VLPRSQAPPGNVFREALPHVNFTGGGAVDFSESKMMRSKKVNQIRRNLIKNAALAVAEVGVGAGLSPTKAEAQPQKLATTKLPAPSSLPLSGKLS
jgi:hypothetical protein